MNISLHTKVVGLDSNLTIMKTKSLLLSLFACAFFTLLTFNIQAQSVTTARQVVDKQEYNGLVLHSSIPDKDLADYWQEYLKQFGKVKGNKNNTTVSNANIRRMSSQPVQIVSAVSGSKGSSQVFAAFQVEGTYVAGVSDRYYRDAEDLLKDFALFAAERDEVKLAQTNLKDTSKETNKLKKDGDKLAKKIQKTEKDLEKMRQELSQNAQKQQDMAAELNRKKSDLESVKSRVRN